VSDYPLEEYARTYPFRYADEDFPNLSRALARHYPDPGNSVAQWTLQFLDSSDCTGTMKMLRAIILGIREQFIYTRRIEKGVQTPGETLRHRRGSCRDFAVLMMEATRSLGIAARFVSGYIFVPDSSGLAGGGATHAWMQAYLPGAGWIDFDPTNSIIGNRNLIRVAVAWDPYHVLPLWGTYSGPPGAFLGMDVTVTVTEVAG
jgi:transglutaminase-like putative cysteine protease